MNSYAITMLFAGLGTLILAALNAALGQVYWVTHRCGCNSI